MIRRFIVPLVLAFLVACGASARTKALQGSLFALNAARDTVLEVSKKREAQIVDACNPPDCTLEKGHAELEAWRDKVDVVVDALAKGYRLIAAAALVSDSQSATEALAAVAKAVEQSKGLQ